MMASLLDLNSDASDSEDDCDYVPPAGELSDNSGNEISEDEESKETKRKKKQNDNKTPEKCDDGKELTAEEEKQRADELWQSFTKDVQPLPKKSQMGNDDSNSNGAQSVVPLTEVQPAKVTVTEVYEFAGEEIKVTKEVDAASVQPQTAVTSALSKSSKPVPVGFLKRPAKGLASVMGTLSKKQKLSTLQKTMLDWKKFKQDEGIEEELEHHNKGKEGYLEKQAFLQRSDFRQFEIEKSLRISKRTKL